MKKKINTMRNLKILFLFLGMLLGFTRYYDMGIILTWIFLSLFISLAFVLNLSLERIDFLRYSIISIFIYIIILYIRYGGYFADCLIWGGTLFFGLIMGSIFSPRFGMKVQKKDSYVRSSFSSAFIIFVACFFFLTLILSTLYDLDEILFVFSFYVPILFLVPLISYFMYGKISFLFEEILEKEPTMLEVKPMKKSPEVPTSPEKVSLILQRLLQEKEEWRAKLDYLKNNKNELIEKGAVTEESYQKRYEEIMDQLVSIEDKIIKEKMKGGKKK